MPRCGQKVEDAFLSCYACLRKPVVAVRRAWRNFRCPCRPARPLTSTVHGYDITVDRVMASKTCVHGRSEFIILTPQLVRLWRRGEDEQTMASLRRTRQIPGDATHLYVHFGIAGERSADIMLSIRLADETVEAVHHAGGKCQCGADRALLGRISIAQLLYPILHPTRGCAKLRETLTHPPSLPKPAGARPSQPQSTWV